MQPSSKQRNSNEWLLQTSSLGFYATSFTGYCWKTGVQGSPSIHLKNWGRNGWWESAGFGQFANALIFRGYRRGEEWRRSLQASPGTLRIARYPCFERIAKPNRPHHPEYLRERNNPSQLRQKVRSIRSHWRIHHPLSVFLPNLHHMIHGFRIDFLMYPMTSLSWSQYQ